MVRRPHVALMIETAGAYGRYLLQGITRYLRDASRDGRCSSNVARSTRCRLGGWRPGRETAFSRAGAVPQVQELLAVSGPQSST